MPDINKDFPNFPTGQNFNSHFLACFFSHWQFASFWSSLPLASAANLIRFQSNKLARKNTFVLYVTW
jgi:hypothetical protein